MANLYKDYIKKLANSLKKKHPERVKMPSEPSAFQPPNKNPKSKSQIPIGTITITGTAYSLSISCICLPISCSLAIFIITGRAV